MAAPHIMSLDELETLILKGSDSYQGLIDFDALPDAFTGATPKALRDIHFINPSRELLHCQMIKIMDDAEVASVEDKETYFRYLCLLTMGRRMSIEKISTSLLSPEREIQKGNPLQIWRSGITDTILSFLQPSEAVALTALSCSFRHNFWTKLSQLSYTCLILGTPWHRCPVEMRRLIFPRFANIQTLRIEPVAASVLVGHDLDDILRCSTRTLKRLYICAPCSTLLLTSPLTMAARGSSSGSLAGSLTSADRSDCEQVFIRVDSADEIGRPGCHYYRSISPHARASFDALSHIELTGNDAYLWAMVVQEWDYPNLKSLTLQTWTDNFYGEDSSSVEETQQQSVDEDLTMQDYQTGCCNEIVECNQIFWCRTERCGRQRRLVFEALIAKVSVSIWDLELVVPGGLTDEDFIYFQSSGRSSIDSCDLLSSTQSSTTSDATTIAIERPHHVMVSIQRQFGDFCSLLQRVLFDRKEMKFLRKLQFLGLHNFSVAVHGVKNALEAEYRLNQDRIPPVESKNSPDINRKHFLDPPFENEPGQPFLPVLDFQDEWDVLQAQRVRSGVESEAIVDRTDWPDVRSPPIGRCLIVFSGTIQIPQKSCVEFKVLYPLCIQKCSRMSLPSSSNDGFDPFSPILPPEKVLTDFHSPVLDATLLQPRHLSLDQVPCPSPNADESRRSSYAKPVITMKLRMQQDSVAVPPREFQRLQHLVYTARQRFLQPGPRQSTKGKPPSKKKVILEHREAPQDASGLLSQFSEATTEFGVGFLVVDLVHSLSIPLIFIQMFLGDHSSTIRPLTVMRFPILDSIRFVNWHGGNRSHLALFSLVTVSPPRHVHLTIEATDAHYHRIRRKNAKGFYTSLVRFLSLLKSRGMLIDRLSFFPGPEEKYVACMNYFFPTLRLHTAAPSRIFIDPFEPYGVPHCLFTVFPCDEELTSAPDDSRRPSVSTADIGEEEDDDEEFVPTPPQLAINSQVLEVSAPLRRGYSSIREFLVAEVERQSLVILSGNSRSRPSASSISVAWKGTAYYKWTCFKYFLCVLSIFANNLVYFSPKRD